jgi:hypothetical protein
MSNEIKEAFIVGNGESIKDFNYDFFKDKKTVGTGKLKNDWYPDFYVCVNLETLKSNLESIKNMIINKKCEVFLLNAEIIQEWEDILQYSNVMFIQQLRLLENNPFRYLVDSCSGSCGVLFAYILGFHKLNLLGMDCPDNEDRFKIHKKSWEDLRNVLVMYNVLTQEGVELWNYNSNKNLDHSFKKKDIKELEDFELIE